MEIYALLENGNLHTDNLTAADAEEMRERHARIFDTHIWEVVPMGAVVGMDRMLGLMEKQRQSAIRYHSVR